VSFIKDLIAEEMQDAEFRAAYEEEVELTRKEQERRRQVMTAVATMRKAQHLSQQQLAARLKVSQARVSQMERGTESLSVDSLLEMVDALRGGIVILSPDEIAKFGLERRLVMEGEAMSKKMVEHAHKGATTGKIVHKAADSGKLAEKAPAQGRSTRRNRATV
jgi:transcriptional regulator with XRE-family HTH domain